MAARLLLGYKGHFGRIFQRTYHDLLSKPCILSHVSCRTGAIRCLASSAVPIVIALELKRGPFEFEYDCATLRPRSDADDEVNFPQAADSHLTPSMFDDEHVNKLVNYMMYDGKKSLAQKIIREAFEVIKETQLEEKRTSQNSDGIETNPLTIFHAAVKNSMPVVGVFSMRKVGKTFQVPTPLTPSRQRFLAMKWIISAARDQPVSKNARMKNKLAKELLDAFGNKGAVIKKKHELHKRAEANRAFAHYRWW